MKLKITALSQRDPRWAGILLGYNTNSAYSIGMYGCLITCLSAITDRTPDVTNTILKNNNGFVSGGNFVWGASTYLGLKQLYVSPSYSGPVTDLGVSKAKEYLDQQYPLLAEVDFNPATTGEEMHFVEIIGYDDGTENFIMMDPWTGEVISMDRYGGFRRAVIQFRVYDKKLPLVTSGTVTTTVPVESKVFEELVRKSTICDKIANIWKTDTSETIMIENANKTLTYEDAIRQKDRQIADMNSQMAEYGLQINGKTEELKVLAAQNKELQEQVGKLTAAISESQQKIDAAISQNTTLVKQIDELKRQKVPVFKGWRKVLFELIMK